MPIDIQRQSTVLLTDALSDARAFLVDVAGFEVAMDIGWFASLAHPETGALVDLWARDHEKVPAVHAGIPGGYLVALVVEDLAATEAAFVAGGAEITEPAVDEPWGQRHFFARAPGGIVFDVVQPIPPDLDWLAAHGLAT